jgi:hypothetical protein
VRERGSAQISYAEEADRQQDGGAAQKGLQRAVTMCSKAGLSKAVGDGSVVTDGVDAFEERDIRSGARTMS